MSGTALQDWVPSGIEWTTGGPLVSWCRIGDVAFTDPFFEDTIQRCLRRPFNLLFRRRTPIAALRELHTRRPGLTPTGFIFHTSRCGSTLISQLLAALPQHIVISEAAPIDAVLRGGDVSDDDRVQWLQWLVSALGRPRRGESRYFIKFDAWSVMHWPLIARAFPDVPSIFVKRERSEVMASHARQPGAHMVPQLIDPELFAIERELAAHMPRDEYMGRVLDAIEDAAAQFVEATGALTIDYRALPDAVWSILPRHWGFALGADDVTAMRQVARFDAKQPRQLFSAAP